MALEYSWYSVGATVAITALSLGASYMAFRKPRPLKFGISFDNQSEEDEVNNIPIIFVLLLNTIEFQADPAARRCKLSCGSSYMTHLYDDALTLYDVLHRGAKETGQTQMYLHPT